MLGTVHRLYSCMFVGNQTQIVLVYICWELDTDLYGLQGACMLGTDTDRTAERTSHVDRQCNGFVFSQVNNFRA